MVKIGIIGDLMVDIYSHYDCTRVSPEAPVPVLTNSNTKKCLGGAANVAKNLSEYDNFDLNIFGTVGNDKEGRWIIKELKKIGCNTKIRESKLIPTIQKHRILAGQQQICRLDSEKKVILNDISIEEFKFDAIIISDYGKSTFGCPSQIIAQSKFYNIPTFVDPKGNNFDIYRGAYCLKPNKKEFENIMGKCENLNCFKKKGAELIKRLELENLVITLGKEGIFYLNKEGDSIFIKGERISVFNVTGAGDTVLTSIVASRLLGKSWENSLVFAKYCAEYVISLSETGFLSKKLINKIMEKIK